MDRLLEKDMVVRIISVLLAVVIWAQVSSDQNALKTRRMDVPVVPVGLLAGFQVTAVPGTVPVELQGTNQKLDRLVPSDVKALADLSSLNHAGTFDVPLNISLPTGLGITVSTSPAHVTVTIEQRIEIKKRPLITPQAAVIEGDRRISVSQPALDVVIGGLAPFVNRVDRVVGDATVAGLEKSQDEAVTLHALDVDGNEVKGAAITPEQVQVAVTVTQLPPGKMVPVKAQFQGTLSDAYAMTVDVSPKTVKVRGPADASWTEVLTEPIPLAGRSQSFSTQARLLLPKGGQYLDTDVVTVAVTLSEARDKQVLKNVPLKVINLAPNLTATLAVTEVQATLSGPKRLLAALDPTKVEAYVDVQNLQAGEHRLQVAVRGAEGLEATVSPEIVAVALTARSP